MALTNIVTNIDLDVYDHDLTPTTIKAIALDSKTRYVAAALLKERNPYGIPQTASVTLTVLRPDNTGVQVTGSTYSYDADGTTMYGAYAELTQLAIAIKGTCVAQFKVTDGEQILHTEIFYVNNGRALDADIEEWAGDLDGHNLDEMAESIETLETSVGTLQTDVATVKEGLQSLSNSVKNVVALESSPVTYTMLTGKVIGATGIVSNASGDAYKVSDYIPVVGGTVVTCAYSRARWGNQNWAFYDADKNVVSTYGKTASSTTVEYFSKIIVPLNAKYFVLARDENSISGEPDSDVTIITKYAEAISSAPKSAVRSSIRGAITEALVTAEDSSGKIIGTRGNVVSISSTDYRVSTISVNNGDVLNIRNCQARYSNKMYSFYDASGLPICSQDRIDNDAHSFMLLEVPFGAVTLAVSGFQSYATVHKVTNVAEGSWTGKKWAMIVDSITDANNQRATKRYFDYISEVTGITTVNLGKSGTGYKKDYNSNLPFYQRVDAVPTDSDVITIFGSGNDCSLTLGTPTDSTSDTVCGCINLTIDGIRDRIVGANIGIITPTPWMQYPTTTPDNAMDLYADAIVEICRLKGVPCLDLYHCSNMLPWEEDFRTAFYKHDDGNGTHPDEDGHKLFAPRIKAFLETLLM